jgi:hypothetical protein
MIEKFRKCFIKKSYKHLYRLKQFLNFKYQEVNDRFGKNDDKNTQKLGQKLRQC